MSRRQLRHLSGAKLREARTAMQFTQEGLARELSVTLRTVQRWEDGSSEPRGGQLLHLATKLEVAPIDLYDDGDEQAA